MIRDTAEASSVQTVRRLSVVETSVRAPALGFKGVLRMFTPMLSKQTFLYSVPPALVAGK